MAPGKGTGTGTRTWGPGGALAHLVQHQGVLFTSHPHTANPGYPESFRGLGGTELQAVGAKGRVQRTLTKGRRSGTGKQTLSLLAACRHSPAAPPCPPHPTPLHPAAGGQCRYEEKASIIPRANRHTPDLPYCAPSIEMQTSRVRRPQSAPATQSFSTPRAGAGLGPSSAFGSGL